MGYHITKTTYFPALSFIFVKTAFYIYRHNTFSGYRRAIQDRHQRRHRDRRQLDRLAEDAGRAVRRQVSHHSTVARSRLQKLLNCESFFWIAM